LPHEKWLEGAESSVAVFTGAMDYWANVDAVKWFADQVTCICEGLRQDIWPATREARSAWQRA
jgi:hypothetical protein